MAIIPRTRQVLALEVVMVDMEVDIILAAREDEDPIRLHIGRTAGSEIVRDANDVTVDIQIGNQRLSLTHADLNGILTHAQNFHKALKIVGGSNVIDA